MPVIEIEYFKADTHIHRLHPFTKIIFELVVFVIAAVINAPIYMCVFILAIVALIRLAHIPARKFRYMWIVAYIVLFLPAALGNVRTSLVQISPIIEQAARILGKSPTQVFTSITLPLLISGILAGAIMVLMLTMKELPATLILSPIGFKTLATSIWWATEDVFFAKAAAPALLLILLSSIPMGGVPCPHRTRLKPRRKRTCKGTWPTFV